MISITVPSTYRLRSGDLVRLTGTRDALKLDGKTREPIFYGKFVEGGELIAFNRDGSYRASSGRFPHRFDLVEKICDGG